MEEIVGSIGKVKILKVIYKLGEVNITRISRETGLNHKSVSIHLEELKKMGIVYERRFGRVRMLSLNYLNPKVLVLSDLLNFLNDE
ncbi:winged helix-turn-helix transcriptional regulator [Fervidicoccus fontis]|uniref:HTH arsR-type domain-containing protein n=2 Tax=Fervidicoccus fontis TaxID=683846 RepID=I0A2Z7_FERFK|nr:winged helix-turn-helix domain-containing protein [Fervidicoccus fontis]AFH43354.1 hypothetical protein FFONT_1366 [Fervidicoccus fontis Kam940]MBE9390731.1 winged helix-turn-helix transcriptional regulator [Fervidicoccus fontis]